MKKYVQFMQHSTKAQDTVIAIDTSPSQNYTDLKPSRLHAAVAAIICMLEILKVRFPSDRVGLVSFNATAKVVHPMVEVGRHFESLEKALQRLETFSATNISDGLEKAGRLLRSDRVEEPWHPRGLLRIARKFLFDNHENGGADGTACERGKRIILTSDGCHNSGKRDPVTVARLLKKQGVQIDVVGVGGSPTADEYDEAELRSIASPDPDSGMPRYVFINDSSLLIREFQRQALLRPVKE